MKIISLSGLMGSGKDTAAAHLIEHHGYKKISFSAALKDVVAAVFGWKREFLEGDTPLTREWRETLDPWWDRVLGFEEEVTPRSMLQRIGTEVMRDNFCQSIWPLALERRILNMGVEGKLVSTDTRFFEEFAMMKRMGATIVGVHRKMPPYLERFYSGVEHDMQFKTGQGFMESDQSEKSTMIAIRDTGDAWLKRNRIKWHRSEWEAMMFNKYDAIVGNNGTIDDLKKKMDELA